MSSPAIISAHASAIASGDTYERHVDSGLIGLSGGSRGVCRPDLIAPPAIMILGGETYEPGWLSAWLKTLSR
jgi:hypothetical protein